MLINALGFIYVAYVEVMVIVHCLGLRNNLGHFRVVLVSSYMGIQSRLNDS